MIDTVNMHVVKKRFRLINVFVFIVIISVVIGCSATLSSINNIRRVDQSIETGTKDALTFLTYNIRISAGDKNKSKFPPKDTFSKNNLDIIAKIIELERSDVVALQEVNGGAMAKYLAEKLNFNYSFLSHQQSGYALYGLAILSKFKIIAANSMKIHTGFPERRGLICTIDIDGLPIKVMNLHYALQSYDYQVKATMKYLEKVDGPVILMGDFNRTILAPVMTPIREKFVDTCNAVDTEGSRDAKTWGTLRWGSFGDRIDFIFISSEYFEVFDVGLHRKYAEASDHRAYWAKLKLKN